MLRAQRRKGSCKECSSEDMQSDAKAPASKGLAGLYLFVLERLALVGASKADLFMQPAC